MTVADEWDITRSSDLTDEAVAQIRTLAGAVETLDGAPPLDEHAELRLAGSHRGLEHIVVRVGDTLVGYAQIESADPGLTGAELLVGPAGSDEPTRPDVAAALLGEVESIADGAAVLVWARGDRSPVRTAAEAGGYRVVRTLLTMSRPLAGLDTTRRELPAGLSIRPFVPGRDDTAWLGVNARAFATHPEQGRWTQADLDDRIAQPWFDPAGFLLLVDAQGSLLGFHWTKRHPATSSQPAVAEVYVIGMDPSAQGRGLGRTLLLAGLEHLQGPGANAPAAETVILYTDDENQGAVHLYQATGFTIARREVQYRRP